MHLLWLTLAALAHAQSGATLEGLVRNSGGQAQAAALVYLTIGATGKTQTTRTDKSGTYRFSGLPAGNYTLRADGESTGRTVALRDGETGKFDLTLDSAFFDEPSFIVAGVTDPVSRGGHGSDTVLRSSEALAKATASLGAAEEERGGALEAVRAYQKAAEADPSEQHLFDWATELLMHRAAEPAAEVFARGHRMYPQSLRLLLGLAAALYARGDYAHAAQRFFEACDVNPKDPGPYLFLGKVQSVEVTQLPAYAEKLARFAGLYPDDARANYYYAAALWKQHAPDDSDTPRRVVRLLEQAVRLDSSLGDGYLLLGIVYSEQREDAKAIAAYQQAIAAEPQLDEPHYRLGQTYGRIGQRDKARQELEIHERMSREMLQARERERREIRQFVFELR